MNLNPYLLLVVACAGCGSGASSTTSSAQPAPTMGTGSARHPIPGKPASGLVGGATSTAMATSTATDTAGPIGWQAPPAWEKLAVQNPMRVATYRIPDGSKAQGPTPRASASPSAPESGPGDAELTVSQAGGDVDSNVTRWAGQFEGSPAPKREERTGTGFKVTVVEVEGTFQGMALPGASQATPKPGTKLLAAIVDADGSLVFFKMTGPIKTVDAARSDFEKLLASLRRTP